MIDFISLPIRTYMRPRLVFHGIIKNYTEPRATYTLFAASALFYAALNLILLYLHIDFLDFVIESLQVKSTETIQALQDREEIVQIETFFTDQIAYYTNLQTNFQKIINANPVALAGSLLIGIVWQFIAFMVITSLIAGVGRLFGGTATAQQCRIVCVWWGFVNLFGFALCAVLLFFQAWGILLLYILCYGIVTLYVLCAGIAEAHQFKSVSLTALGMIGSLFVVTILLSYLL